MGGTGEFGLELFVTVAALVAVLVLAWFAIRSLAQVAGTRGGAGRMRLLQSTAVGSRERIVLLSFDGHEYLLGVTPGGINLLDKRSAADDPRSDGSQ